MVAYSFDVVAVRITDKSTEIVFVVLGPHPRLVQHLGARANGRVEESPDGGPVGGGKGDVRLTEAVAGLLLADPEVRHRRHAVADHSAEVHDAGASERRQNRVVEGRT